MTLTLQELFTAVADERKKNKADEGTLD